MANKYKIICPNCGEKRVISRSMLSLIKNGKSSGRCLSCSSLNNKRRYKGKIYNKNLYKSSLYSSWVNMKTRCTNIKSPSFKRYGARGITICRKWDTFAGFLEDMKSSYKKGLTIERVNNSEGYYKKNCRWATKKEQANNTRRNRIIKWQGLEKTLAQWSEIIGLNRTTITQRIDYYGWSIEKALSTMV